MTQNTTHSLYISCARGMAEMLLDEVKELGFEDAKVEKSGVRLSADMEGAYRLCLWSRLGSRVFLHLANFNVEREQDIYDFAIAYGWQKHLLVDSTFAVHCTLRRTQIKDQRFAALKLKDGIADAMRNRFGTRPNVDSERPGVSFHLHINQGEAQLSLDLAGQALNQRGYRTHGAFAPLRETLAAALLRRCKWRALSQKPATFVDPMCGSGTLLIEAAQMAADIAPGLGRDYFGFLGWKEHHPPLWQMVKKEAEERAEKGLARLGGEVRIIGADKSPKALSICEENIRRAGLAGKIEIHQRGLEGTPALQGPGLMLTNPPWGERLGDEKALEKTYATLGEVLKTRFEDFDAAIFTSSMNLAKATGLYAFKRGSFHNGPLKCFLCHYDLSKQHKRSAEELPEKPLLTKDAESFRNRLKKNIKKLKPWLKKEGITAYRIYDADIPEYAVAVDVYGDALHIQEYKPPKDVETLKAKRRLEDVCHLAPEVLGMDPERVYTKVRQQQKGKDQYQKEGSERDFFVVEEGGLKFWVNLSDYLDTGLFLDHRRTRDLIRNEARGKRFLNLFAYTGTASVYAADGGAQSTTSVDLSNTYCAWAERNFRLNKMEDKTHQVIRADALAWIADNQEPYDLIFVDPPTFSNSKSMEATWDVGRDHPGLISMAMASLAPGGTLIFSNNFRRFKMSREILDDYAVENLSAKTLSKDFERNPKIHNTWRIRKV